MTRIAVIIPTLCRPQPLEAAIKSLFALNDPQLITRLVVVDNDPQATAEAVARQLADQAPFPVVYAMAPEPGIASARNAGVQSVGDVELIAFLDDDEVAHPQWLDELLKVQRRFEADVVFGPIRGRSAHTSTRLRPIVENFFSRHGPEEDCVTEASFGCGNSLMRRGTALAGDAPFAKSSDETGGEDDLLFSYLRERGLKFAWASDAWVDEVVSPQRSSLNYLLLRGFARGQGPSQTAFEQRNFARLMFWMSVGLIQLGVFSLSSILSGFQMTHTGIQNAIRASEGAGKCFWFKIFEPKLYGLNELLNRRQTPTP